jgi:general secretion pathway protein F
MATFTYKAIESSGKKVSGQADSASKEELAAKLKEGGLYLLSWKEVPVASAAEDEALAAGQKLAWHQELLLRAGSLFKTETDYRRLRGGVKAKTLATITWQMAIGLKSGITLTELLDTIARESQDPKVRVIFAYFYSRVSSGHTLTDSLAVFPDVFSEIYVNLVRAGEAGGFLPKSLEEAAAYIKAQDRLARKVKSMMIYPAMLTVVASGTIVFMAAFIMPVFVQVFTDMNAELPALTKMLLAFFGLLRDFWYAWLVLLAAAFFSVRKVYLRSGSSLVVDSFILRIPFFGSLMLKIALSRFLGTLSVLLKTNVSILAALNIGKAVSGNAVLAREIDAIYKAVQAGKPMAEKMVKNRCFPAMVTMMVANGERSGCLPESLDKVTEYFTEEVDLAIADAVGLMEPLIIVIMGAMIAVLAAGLLMPIFDLPGYVG